MAGLTIHQLIDYANVEWLDTCFMQSLSSLDRSNLESYRLGNFDNEEWLLQLAVKLEDFLLAQFGIENQYDSLQHELKRFEELEWFAKSMVVPAVRSLRRNPFVHCSNVDDINALISGVDDEIKAISILKCKGLEDGAYLAWCQWVWANKVQPYMGWRVFSLPERIDFNQLLDAEKPVINRLDFQYVGPTLNDKDVDKHIHYCLYCHQKDNDACSHGLVVKTDNVRDYKISPLGRKLSGCPLNQKISQMHLLRQKNHVLAALAVIMIENPLCVATGDRICNDCMASCIYQKFDPVDTPSIESNTLQHILSLTYGAEIYLLLARWNPLKPYGYKLSFENKGSAAVIGMGPAGFAMSYYLLMSGCTVLGLDGLSIPKPKDDIFHPIKSFSSFKESINDAEPTGFGGVMQYGITMRWDKSLLNLIWVLLCRMPRFSVLGNMRLGGSISLSSLVSMGFDQIILATGSGLPKEIDIPNSFAPGMLFANDFLMRLHLSGALTQTLKSGLQMPVVVIGGGLTAVDAATEAQVYYIKWVQQVIFQHESLVAMDGWNDFFQELTQPEQLIMERWLKDGVAIRRFIAKKMVSQVKSYIQDIGGVTILYRRRKQDSPAYKQNHYELESALRQGILYREEHQLLSCRVNNDGHVDALSCQHGDNEIILPARTVMVATGSKPNVAYYYENRSELSLDKGYYKRSKRFTAASEALAGQVHVIGDLHPDYQGSVVGALASAKDSYKSVLENMRDPSEVDLSTIHLKIKAHVQSVEDVTDKIIAISLVCHQVVKIGTYFRVSVSDGRGAVSQVTAIAVDVDKSNVKAWLWRSALTGMELSLDNIQGVMGPSGMRLVSSNDPNHAIIVADDKGWIWACAVANAMHKRLGRVCILSKSLPPVELRGYFDDWKDLKCLKSGGISSSSPHVLLYCSSVKTLKQVDPWLRPMLSPISVVAAVDGSMMCLLKGVCGQCLQWQISEDGKRSKAVYSCSWPMQPIELIDTGHLYERQYKPIADEKLLTRWYDRQSIVQE